MAEQSSGFGIWIDDSLSTGAGLLEEICPDMLTLTETGYDAVHVDGVVQQHGPEGIVAVPSALLNSVIEAIEEDPSECVVIEQMVP